AKIGRPCPLWVRNRHSQDKRRCPLYPRNQTLAEPLGMSALCQKRTHAPQHYSTLMLANWITFAYFAVSSATNFLKFATDIGIGSTPRLSKRDLRFGSVTQAAVAALSFSIISLGVPVGAQIPYQPLAAYPGTNSAIAGISGAASNRVGVVTPIAFSLPALTSWMICAIGENAIGI